MRTSWFTRFIAMVTLLSWLGAAYHDVWLTAAEVSHHHGHAHHHHDSENDDSQPSTSLPDFHSVAHLIKTGNHFNQLIIHTLVGYVPALLAIWTVKSFENPSDPPPWEWGDSPYQPLTTLLAHCVHPNAPPVFV